MVFGERAPAFHQVAGFRADAGKASKGQIRNEDRTRKMLQQHQEKGIHRMPRDHSPGHLECLYGKATRKTALGRISFRSSPYLISFSGSNSTIYPVSTDGRIK